MAYSCFGPDFWEICIDVPWSPIKDLAEATQAPNAEWGRTFNKVAKYGQEQSTDYHHQEVTGLRQADL